MTLIRTSSLINSIVHEDLKQQRTTKTHEIQPKQLSLHVYEITLV